MPTPRPQCNLGGLRVCLVEPFISRKLPLKFLFQASHQTLVHEYVPVVFVAISAQEGEFFMPLASGIVIREFDLNTRFVEPPSTQLAQYKRTAVHSCRQTPAVQRYRV
mmetsp:Transcript_2368/g.7089  ORF Transcript_2368/g.7089 Transcript_2368/m.7089 type:complete len:108 (+) Transcript_2368:1005-1328(+)